MKQSQIESGWALGFGCVGAPLLSALNAFLIDAMFGLPFPRPSVAYLELGFFVLILTAPLGFITMRMLEIWKSGKPGLARALGVGNGLFALLFWVWFLSSRSHDPDWSSYSRPHLMGALAIPFLWSMLLPLFAVLARAPKPK